MNLASSEFLEIFVRTFRPGNVQTDAPVAVHWQKHFATNTEERKEIREQEARQKAQLAV